MTIADAPARAGAVDLLCFSHLRWDFVFQRPQHLLCRAAKTMRVFFFEEPLWVDEGAPSIQTRTTPEGVIVSQPVLPNSLDWGAYDDTVRQLLDQLIALYGIAAPVLWYYTPHALAFSGHVRGHPTVYDCMDELSAFKDADPALPGLERRLIARADLVFTGGHSLFEAKRGHHAGVHCFPSGVDTQHFAPARGILPDPADQAALPHPRMGFFGVLDERLDLGLLSSVAGLRPHMQFVMVGPVAKIDEAGLPRPPNIHYLGPKPYADLPAYLAHWEVALMPFALNGSTQFISPTKTPEYLAAGRPVVTTPICDVVRQYGGLPCVHIANTAHLFARACDRALQQANRAATWLPQTDAALAKMSWDAIWAQMNTLINDVRIRLDMNAAAQAGCLLPATAAE